MIGLERPRNHQQDKDIKRGGSLRILVTGGAGFIGSALVRTLVADQTNFVTTIDKLTYAGNLDSLSGVIEAENHTFERIDIADEAAVRGVVSRFRPRYIFHLAAESHVDRSIDGPAEFLQTNVFGTFVMLQEALRFWRSLPPAEKVAFRFLHVSTDEVFGSLGEEGLFSEDTRYDPSSPYSATKAASDHLVRAWHRTYGLPVVLTNCSNNYGPYQFPEKLLPHIVVRAIGGDTLPVYGKGENIRDWLHVKDHVSALIEVASRGRIGETYLISGRNEWRNIDMVREICHTLDEIRPRSDGRSYETQIRFVSDRPGHDFRYAIDSGKIEDEIGWRPSLTPKEGIRNTVEWYLENEGWLRRVLSGEYRTLRIGLGGWQ